LSPGRPARSYTDYATQLLLTTRILRPETLPSPYAIRRRHFCTVFISNHTLAPYRIPGSSPVSSNHGSTFNTPPNARSEYRSCNPTKSLTLKMTTAVFPETLVNQHSTRSISESRGHTVIFVVVVVSTGSAIAQAVSRRLTTATARV
jgi:hypothetical protein